MKPIQAAFKLAQAGICLGNEWRDSLFYTALSAFTGEQLWRGHMFDVRDHNLSITAFFLATSLREWGRRIAWNSPSEASLAGYNSNSLDSTKNAYAAGIVADLLQIGFNGSVGVILAPMALTAMPLLMWNLTIHTLGFKSRGGTLRTLWEVYFDKKDGMWNWPGRNRDGGGTTQTQKLIKGFSELGQRLGGALPNPARVAAFIPRRRHAAAMPR